MIYNADVMYHMFLHLLHKVPVPFFLSEIMQLQVVLPPFCVCVFCCSGIWMTWRMVERRSSLNTNNLFAIQGLWVAQPRDHVAVPGIRRQVLVTMDWRWAKKDFKNEYFSYEYFDFPLKLLGFFFLRVSFFWNSLLGQFPRNWYIVFSF